MSFPPSPNQVDQKPYGLAHNSSKVGLRSGMSAAGTRRSFRYTLVLGAVIGLTFSLALWAVDSVVLFLAHAAYPWISLLVGTILAVLICSGAALLTWLANRALLGLVFWVLAARLIALLSLSIPLQIAPRLMMLLDPALRAILPSYPMNATFRTWGWFATIWLAIFFALTGLLQLTLVESAVPSTTSAGRVTPYFVFIPLILIASFMSSNMINQQLRAPIVATNDAIQFAIENQAANVDPAVARTMHMSTIDALGSLIHQPHRIFLRSYDGTYYQVDLLIDFNGTWADCNTANTQPVYCKLIPTS